mgnify:CR=1 FL=1
MAKKRLIAKVTAFALAFSLLAGVGADSSAEAAKKPKLAKKKITVNVGKSKKVKFKNVKAKNIKKIKIKLAKKAKKIVKVKKVKKKAIKVTGKKAGSAKVVVKLKLKGTSSFKKLKLKVKVTEESEDASEAPSADASASAASSASASANPSASANASAAASADASAAASADVTAPATETAPAVETTGTETAGIETSTSETSDITETPEPLMKKTWTFDDETDLNDWVARGYDENTTIELSEEDHTGNGGNSLRICNRQDKTWSGPMFDLSEVGIPGASYKITFSAKVPDEYSEDLDGEEIRMRFSGESNVTPEDSTEYRNYPADTDYNIYADEWQTFTVTEQFTAPTVYSHYAIYFETNGGAKFEFLVDDITLEVIATPAEADLSLTGIKDAYSDFKYVGVATTYTDLMSKRVMTFIKHHYSSITLGNAMKPDAIMNSKTGILQSEANYIIPDDYAEYDANKDADGNVLVPELNLDQIGKIMQICKDNDLGLRIHSPMWHQQMPKFFFCEGFDEEKPLVTDPDVILSREYVYIKNLLEYILTNENADVVYAYDVVNEYVHMDNEGGQVGSENWWKYSFGTEMSTECKYVKLAYVWAYEMLQEYDKVGDISLIYNDYSTYVSSTTENIIKLINFVNTEDDLNPYGKICDGIGMQAHLGENWLTADQFGKTIDAFAEQGYEIQITELDVTKVGTVDDTTTAEQKAEIEEECAQFYKEIMAEILRAKGEGANITSLTIWGLCDATSWRADRSPLPFGTDISDVKPAYYSIIEAAEEYQNASIVDGAE